MWREWREKGLPIKATWLDRPTETEGAARRSLSARCIEEAKTADIVILYAEPEDFLKGALLECGAALAAGRPDVVVGNGRSVNHIFSNHPLWFSADNVESAIALAKQLAREVDSATPEQRREFGVLEHDPVI
jgi:hypothetical protein